MRRTIVYNVMVKKLNWNCNPFIGMNYIELPQFAFEFKVQYLCLGKYQASISPRRAVLSKSNYLTLQIKIYNSV